MSGTYENLDKKVGKWPSFTDIFQFFRMCQTYWVELVICVYRHLPIFLSSFSYVPDLLGWVGYLCLSSFNDIFQFFRMYQTYWVELAICVYRHLPIFLSSFSYVPDLLGWVGYLCLSSFTDLFLKFFVCTRLTGLSWLFKSGTYEKLDKKVDKWR
jgi:hypothetical protein